LLWQRQLDVPGPQAITVVQDPVQTPPQKPPSQSSGPSQATLVDAPWQLPPWSVHPFITQQYCPAVEHSDETVGQSMKPGEYGVTQPPSVATVVTSRSKTPRGGAGSIGSCRSKAPTSMISPGESARTVPYKTFGPP
jgi:hypothetical protein